MAKKRELAPTGCRGCRGTGRISRESQSIDPQTGLQVTVYSQAHCDCPRGVWLLQKWRKRQYQLAAC